LSAFVLHRHGAVRQFARFAVVGVSNTLVSFAAYLVFVDVSLPYVAASALAFSLGALNGYVLNCHWTFAARDTGSARALYVAVQAGGAAASAGLVWLGGHGLGLGEVGAYVLAVPPVAAAMFVANRLWTFHPDMPGNDG